MSCTSLTLKFSALQDIVKKIKRPAIVGEKKFARDTNNKELLLKLYKELLKLSNKKTKNEIFKWAKNLNRHFTTEDIQMANIYKKMFPSHIIRKIQSKTTMRCHYTPVGMAKVQNSDNTKSGQR